jgi:CBS domain-containing protein
MSQSTSTAHETLSGAVALHMTRDPLSIERRSGVRAARQLMAERHVRHLPVLEGQEIAGVLEERDAFGAPLDAVVEEVMTRDPLVVAPTAPISEVALRMLRRGQRCVLVAADKRLLGIFTSADALALLGGGDDVEQQAPRCAPTCDRWGHILRP